MNESPMKVVRTALETYRDSYRISKKPDLNSQAAIVVGNLQAAGLLRKTPLESEPREKIEQPQVVYEALPSFILEIGETGEFVRSGEKARGTIRWKFHSAFTDGLEACAAADRLAEKNKYVRVVSRES